MVWNFKLDNLPLCDCSNCVTNLMRPKKIVLTLIEPPLPMGNAAARWFYVLIKELAGRGHELDVFATCSKLSEIEATRDLLNGTEIDLQLFPFPTRRRLISKFNSVRRPFSYMFSDEFQLALNKRLESEFDVLHMEQLLSGWLAKSYRNKSLINVHFLNAIDQETMQVNGIRNRFVQLISFQVEKRLLRSYKYINGLTPRISSRIAEINSSAIITSHPIGIDLQLYPFIPDHRRGDNQVIGLIGNMNWYPSFSAARRLCRDLWPEIIKNLPAARLQIVGWGARSQLREFVGMPNVDIIEDVSDIQPYFESTSVLLYAPSSGSGMKIKVMEAFCYGVPVVTTSEGVEGLPAKDGIHAGICDDDEGLIARVVSMLRDSDKQNTIRRSARELMASYCSPKSTVDAFEGVYDLIVANNLSAPSQLNKKQTAARSKI